MGGGDAPVFTDHGVFVAVEGSGVLLRGESNLGKSEIGLELVSRGHRLVADDAIDLHRIDDRLIGRCPPLLRGFIEIRGLGVLDVARMYGEASIAEEAVLELVIDLAHREQTHPDQRLDGRRSIYRALGVEVPEISLPRRVGHNLAVLVEAACRDHRLRREGYVAADALIALQSRHVHTPDT